MRLSTSTNIVLRRPDGKIATVEEAMDRCAKAGYQVMDMNFFDSVTFKSDFITDHWEQWINRIGNQAKELNLEFSQAHASFYNFCDRNFTDADFWEMTVKRSILCAEILSIPWVVVHAGTAFDAEEHYRNESLKRNLEYFKGLLDFASEHNVGIAIENLWDRNIWPQKRYTANAEELKELINACQTFAGDNVGACWDFEHADMMDQDQRAGLVLLGEDLRATHASDQTSLKNDHILPFFGRIDWKEMIQILNDIEYKGDFTYECHRYTMGIPDELLDAALRYSVKVGEFIISQGR